MERPVSNIGWYKGCSYKLIKAHALIIKMNGMESIKGGYRLMLS
jgi:hypothetical protein